MDRRKGATSGSALEFANNDGGFRLIDIAGPLRLQVWGFWLREVTQALELDALPQCEAVGRGRHFVLDATGLKPQGPDGLHGIGRLLSSLPSWEPRGGTLVVDSALTRLQLLRMLGEYDLASWMGVRSHWGGASGDPA